MKIKSKVSFTGFYLRMNSQKFLKKVLDKAEEESKPNYYVISKKDRSLIRLLFLMSLVFFICNLPMAIGRIIQSFDFDIENKFFREFTIVANVMEIFFAASNFYLYCVCNYQFRKNVSLILYH